MPAALDLIDLRSNAAGIKKMYVIFYSKNSEENVMSRLRNRISFLVALLMLLPPALASSNDTSRPFCSSEALTSEPPFYVSSLSCGLDTQADCQKSVAEKMKESTKSANNLRGLPALSIVRPINASAAEDTFEKMSQGSKSPLTIAVEVVSLPNANSVKEMRTSGHDLLADNAKSLKPAVVGDQGTVKASALQKSGNYLYKIIDDTILDQMPESVRPYLGNGSIKYVEVNGQYKARSCCRHAGPGPGADCILDYQIEIVSDDDPNRVVIGPFYDKTECGISSGLLPVGIDQVQPLKKMLQEAQTKDSNFKTMRFFDNSGLMKIPLSSEPPKDWAFDDVTKFDMTYGPANTVHYHGNHKVDPNNNDAYAQPMSACAFFKATETFNKICKGDGCVVQWGDFYHSPAINEDAESGHKDHGSGQCVDVRLMHRDFTPIGKESNFSVESRKNSLFEGMSYKKRAYDREKTQALIDILIAAGGVGRITPDSQAGESNKIVRGRRTTEMIPTPLFFNDRRADGVEPLDGHDDHIHVCFPIKDRTVQNTCVNGITLTPSK
jgi:hypothetical protein